MHTMSLTMSRSLRRRWNEARAYNVTELAAAVEGGPYAYCFDGIDGVRHFGDVDGHSPPWAWRTRALFLSCCEPCSAGRHGAAVHDARRRFADVRAPLASFGDILKPLMRCVVIISFRCTRSEASCSLSLCSESSFASLGVEDAVPPLL